MDQVNTENTASSDGYAYACAGGPDWASGVFAVRLEPAGPDLAALAAEVQAAIAAERELVEDLEVVRGAYKRAVRRRVEASDRLAAAREALDEALAA